MPPLPNTSPSVCSMGSADGQQPELAGALDSTILPAPSGVGTRVI